MKTPKANREEVRSKTLCISMTKEERDCVRKMAHESGLTDSSWARMILNKEIEK
jgi:hypothetical protein